MFVVLKATHEILNNKIHEIKARIHETKGRHFQKFTKDIHEMIAIRSRKKLTRNLRKIADIHEIIAMYEVISVIRNS